MNRLSCNELTTYRWSFEEDLENYQRLGISNVGIWRQKLSDYGEDRGIELLHEHNLKVSNLLWAGGFTGSDGRPFRDSIDDAAEAIRLAAALRCECLVVYSGGRAVHTLNHARRLLRDALDALLPIAEDHEVTLALEPMHAAYAAEWTFLTNLKQSIDLVESYAHQNLKLVFDTYHFGAEPDLIERISSIAPLLAIVHLGDGRHGVGGEQNRTRLGDGEIPLDEIVRTLEGANYTGLYDLELVGPELQNSHYCDVLTHSKRVFESYLQTARVV